MRFGLFVPQGWRHDLVGIEPANQWEAMLGVARLSRGPRPRVDLGLRPLPHRSGAQRGGHPRGLDADGGVRRGDEPGAARPDVHLHGLPQPDVPGEGGRDRGRRQRRPGRDGHRRRAGTSTSGTPTATASPPRATASRCSPRASRSCARPGDGRRHVRRRALPGGRRHLPAHAPAGGRASRCGSPAAARRRRCGSPPSTRSTRTSTARPRASGTSREVLERALPGSRPGLRRDRAVGELQRVHRSRRGRGGRPARAFEDRLRPICRPEVLDVRRCSSNLDRARGHARAARGAPPVAARRRA